jgi:stage II sporulation protein D
MRARWPAIGILLLAGCCYYAPVATVRRGGGIGREPAVRVRLSTGDAVGISSDRGLVLVAGSLRRQVAADQPVDVRPGAGIAVTVAGRAWQVCRDTLVCTTAPEATIRVGSRRYRGSLLVFGSADEGLIVVNLLPIEAYLAGVVPCEIGSIEPGTVEAVKAQAVAARSFTLARREKHRYAGYDLWDSYLRDQEYQGAGQETEIGRQAVAATRGEVLEYRGLIAEALYHANCGGVTSNGFQPFLKSVRDAPGHRSGAKPYCSGFPNFSWRVVVSRDSLESAVARIAKATGGLSIRGFRLDKDRQSGRVKYLHFGTARGEVRVHGSDFRAGLGLRSQNFGMQMHGSSVTIDGRGFGHGAGMCQDGAVGMARSGSRYKQILCHYYSGVRLTRVY